MDILTIFWHQVSWKDAMDILLVAFIIYQSLLIVHGTQAVQILLGMLLLMALYLLGNTYDLHALRWILDNFFESLFIITVIIFQSEIRSALASFGSRQNFISSFLTKQAEDPEINEIVEACNLMSKEKIGALIVLSKESGLADYMSTGTRMDSVIHSDLLYAIFQSSSPLHDGAAILNKGRLAAQGACYPSLKRTTWIAVHGELAIGPHWVSQRPQMPLPSSSAKSVGKSTSVSEAPSTPAVPPMS